eukprot:scaffold319202_cov36-Prasinocladus_malaysianus.AAC.1
MPFSSWCLKRYDKAKDRLRATNAGFIINSPSELYKWRTELPCDKGSRCQEIRANQEVLATYRSTEAAGKTP